MGLHSLVKSIGFTSVSVTYTVGFQNGGTKYANFLSKSLRERDEIHIFGVGLVTKVGRKNSPTADVTNTHRCYLTPTGFHCKIISIVLFKLRIMNFVHIYERMASCTQPSLILYVANERSPLTTRCRTRFYRWA